METVAAKLPPKLVQELDSLIHRGRFPNRSEVIRVAVRRFLDDQSRATETASGFEAKVELHKALMARIARDPRYRGRYVAVHGSQVIDSDTNMDVLAKRALGRHETPIQIGLASPDGRLAVARVPGVRVRR